MSALQWKSQAAKGQQKGVSVRAPFNSFSNMEVVLGLVREFAGQYNFGEPRQNIGRSELLVGKTSEGGQTAPFFTRSLFLGSDLPKNGCIRVVLFDCPRL